MWKSKKILAVILIGLISVLFAYLCAKVNIIVAIGFSITPFLLIILLYCFKNPFNGFIIVFIVNYFIMGIGRYVAIPSAGVFFDFFYVLLLIYMISFSLVKKLSWAPSVNFASIVSLLWMLYCFFEFFNPQAVSSKAWFSTIRTVSVYFFITTALVPVVCDNYKKFKSILILWGILTLIGTAKAMGQKFIGFDPWENRWLYQEGGYVTHIIYSGIRYFSFFTDAASFGGAMGQAMVVFLGLGCFEKEKKTKIFYFIVCFFAGFSVIMSGTRAAMIIPFAGLAVFILLSKNLKIIISFTIILIASVGFFRYTHIGDNYRVIFRIRSTFRPTQDASFLVRLKNQQLIREYLADKPFGVGIGHGGVKAKKYTNYSYISLIPTDSWYVALWVETGIIGLSFNLLIMISIIIYSSYLILFKLKNKQMIGFASSLLSGVFGIMVASYANEILGQFPNGVITYTCIAFIMASRNYDKELNTNTTTIADNSKL